ncbi:MAG: HD domain-containing phosphohydrolase [Chloroflexota bacterium]
MHTQPLSEEQKAAATSLRILVVEDSPDDADLMLREVRRGGYEVLSRRVDTPTDMQAALANENWDLILCDYSMPKFSALNALKTLQESGLDIPFIILSGTIQEQNAVDALKAGAHDFILKDKMARLVPAIQRELREAAFRRERLQHERELEAIAIANAAMRTARTLDEMLTSLLDLALKLINTDSGTLWLHDPTVNVVNLTIQRGWQDNLVTSLQPGEDIPGLVLKSSEAVICREYRTDERVIEYNRQRIAEDLGGACIPLRSNDTVVGVLCANIHLPREINPAEIRILMALAEIGGNAIHRMRLHEQTVKQLQRLDALRSIDLVISSTFDLQVTLNVLISHIIKQLEVDAVAVLLIKPGSGHLEFVAGQGFLSRMVETMEVQLGETHAGVAVLGRRTVRVRDLMAQSEKFVRRQPLIGEDFNSYFAVPLIAKGEVKGVMEIFHRAPLNPDPEWLAFLETLGGQTAIAIENATLFQNLQRTNFELIMAYDATIEGWSHALDLRDRETEGHTIRVTDTTLKLAGAMNVPEQDLVPMRRGALLHDIGKMGVPDDILLKPAPLTDEEWKVMRLHPQLAHDWLAPIKYLKDSLEIPYCHHERWDGRGYPRGLRGDVIPLSARIFTVADVWDALTSNRPYRKAWPSTKVVEYIRENNRTRFDPRVVEVFLKNVHDLSIAA